MNTIGERAAWARKQLSKRLHIDVTPEMLAIMTGIRKDEIIAMEAGNALINARSIAHVLGVREKWLAAGEEPCFLDAANPDNVATIPVVDVKLEPFSPVYEIQETSSLSLFIHRHSLELRERDPKNVVAVIVKGESMLPGLYDGDVAFVDLSEKGMIDNHVYLFNCFGESVFRRAELRNGRWWLGANNPDKRIFLDRKKEDGMYVIGRCFWKSSGKL